MSMLIQPVDTNSSHFEVSAEPNPLAAPRDVFYPILQRLADSISQPVTLLSFGRSRYVKDNGWFYIYEWPKMPVGYRRSAVSMPEVVWSIKTAGMVTMYTNPASGAGIDIADGNFSVAELICEDYLYLLSNLLCYGLDNEVAIFNKVVDEVISIKRR